MRLDIGRVVSNEKFVLEFNEQVDLSQMNVYGSYPFTQPVVISGYVKNKFSGIEFHADLNAVCDSVCGRCLAPVSFPLNTEINSFIDLDAEDEESEEPIYIKAGRFIELDDAINEALLFAYPQKVLCKEDCKGLCPVCGADLNKAQCNCLISE